MRLSCITDIVGLGQHVTPSSVSAEGSNTVYAGVRLTALCALDTQCGSYFSRSIKERQAELEKNTAKAKV